jgi:hypothetical protein
MLARDTAHSPAPVPRLERSVPSIPKYKVLATNMTNTRTKREYTVRIRPRPWGLAAEFFRKMSFPTDIILLTSLV